MRKNCIELIIVDNTVLQKFRVYNNKYKVVSKNNLI